MALRDFGECFKLTCHKEVMPYDIYTYENVSMGACSIQSAFDILQQEDRQQFLDNIEKWDCISGNGMFDLSSIQVYIVNWIVKFSWKVIMYLESGCWIIQN